MFAIVKTQSGWAVRNEETGRFTTPLDCLTPGEAEALHKSKVEAAVTSMPIDDFVTAMTGEHERESVPKLVWDEKLCSCRPIVYDGQHVDTEVCGYCEWSSSHEPCCASAAGGGSCDCAVLDIPA